MILIIKSTLSLSILTDQSVVDELHLIHLHSHSLLIRMIRTQFIHSHDNEYNRFKREGFMMNSSGPTDQLSIIILNTVKWFQYSISHYSICLTHPSHTLSCCEGQIAIRFNPYESLSYQHSSLLSSLWLTVRYHHTVSLSTHQSIHMDTKQCMITIR